MLQKGNDTSSSVPKEYSGESWKDLVSIAYFQNAFYYDFELGIWMLLEFIFYILNPEIIEPNLYFNHYFFSQFVSSLIFCCDFVLNHNSSLESDFL